MLMGPMAFRMFPFLPPLAAALLALGSPTAASATPTPLRFDGTERARIAAPDVDRRSVTGTLSGAAGDTVLLLAGPRELRIPVRQVVRFERSRGMRTTRSRGVVTGLVVGALAGMALSAGKASRPTWSRLGPAVILLGGAAGGGIVGALVGGALTTEREAESWERIPLDRLRADLASHAAAEVIDSEQ